MPYTRRIAQGLLVAFAITTLVPPRPAWALRQGAAAQSEETTAGLEEGLTGKPTTMTRREFIKTIAAGGVVATAGGVAGGVVSSALILPPTTSGATTTYDTTTGRPTARDSAGQPMMISVPQAAAITASTAVGAAVAGGAAMLALAPANAEKVLAEQLSTIVGSVGAITMAGQHVIVLVDSEVADVGTVLRHRDSFRAIRGYPSVGVAPLSEEQFYIENAAGRPIVRVIALGSEPLNLRKDTVYVSGLNGQKVWDLLPVVITEALARWQRVQDGADQAFRASIVFDITPYWAVRELTADQVWQVLSSQFA